jgi:pyridoxamine 5'-phosphate oxidase
MVVTSKDSLSEDVFEKNPIKLFSRWFAEAQQAGLKLPEAMTLATVTEDGRAAARMLLLKQVDDLGFVFYTNYQSAKAHELEANPNAALVFHWAPLEHQVRVEGTVTRISAAESDAYFQTRPRESQIGALASPQSQVIESREVLENRAKEIEKAYEGQVIKRPDHWGGYRLKPNRIEFWQGRLGRLHDRLLYELQPDGAWTIKRLAP